MRQNAIGWFDINVNDMNRAATFYQVVFEVKLEDMNDPTDSDAVMKSFPTDMGIYGAGGALVKRQGAFPSVGGTLIYFGVNDCSVEESRVVAAGGEVVQSKMSIGEFGWVSVCKDSEGNLFGLSSMS